MGERAKVILNEFSAKSMLMRDTVDLNKFYTADLKLMIEVAKQEIKKLQEEKDKELERLNKRILTLEETIRRVNNNVLKDIAMIKTHEMRKQEIVQRLFETSKMLEKGSD